MNNKFVVITSINPPTDAVREFAKWPGWTTVVVGDRKSPAQWGCDGVVYLSLEDQLKKYPEFAGQLPENTYIRKMVGYLYAFEHGAQAIFESDDDNIPYADAVGVIETHLRKRKDVCPAVESSSGWVNMYELFGAQKCWPRGFPLHKVLTSESRAAQSAKPMPWGVLQYLADEDPDVDAVYRMTNAAPVYFARGKQISLAHGQFCPFNSQATLWTPDTYPLMFLPVGVRDRVTDILRGYIALSCLWANGVTLSYASPVVFQVRNAHNLLNDFEQEIDLYRHGDAWCKELVTVAGGGMTVSYRDAIQKLIALDVLPSRNLDIYDAFVGHIRS